ncbi:MAG: NAD(+) synthase [Bacillota bacterium]
MSDLDYKEVEKSLKTWLTNKVNKAGADGAVIGISGGIDSAVTAVLCKKVFKKDTLGVILPCNSNKEDKNDAKLLADKFNINYKTKDLSEIYESFVMNLKEDENKEDKIDNSKDMALANIKPRLRMIALYYYASINNYLVIGTDNWSELKVGYFTKYGDGGVDLAPLGRLVKTEVKGLAKHLGIPDKIINKKPSAGLWEGQTDENELGVSYEELDHYILTGEASEEVRERIDKLAEKNAHKTEAIPIPARQTLV